MRYLCNCTVPHDCDNFTVSEFEQNIEAHNSYYGFCERGSIYITSGAVCVANSNLNSAPESFLSVQIVSTSTSNLLEPWLKNNTLVLYLSWLINLIFKLWTRTVIVKYICTVTHEIDQIAYD